MCTLFGEEVRNYVQNHFVFRSPWIDEKEQQKTEEKAIVMQIAIEAMSIIWGEIRARN